MSEPELPVRDVLDGVFDEEAAPAATGPVLPPGLPPQVAAMLAQRQPPPAGSDEEEDDDEEEDEALPEAKLDLGSILMQQIDKPERKQWARLPRMVGVAAKMVWRSARWQGAGVGLLQAITGLGLGAQLLAGNQLLTEALATRAAGGDLTTLVPSALIFALIASVLAVLSAVSSAQQRVTSELVGTHAHGEIMSAAAGAELTDFENPEFYDQLQRAALGGQIRPFQLVSGSLSLLSSVLGVAGLSLALAAIAPILVPLALVAGVPAWLATARNARATFMLSMMNTADGRERGYLRQLLTDRDPAKEVRSFNLVGYLRTRHDVVSARLLERIKKEARRNFLRSIAGTAGSGVGTMLTGAALLGLLVSDRLPVAGAITAAIALQQLRSRVLLAGTGAASIFESSLYLEDYASFVNRPTPLSDQPATVVEPFRRLAAEGVGFRYPGAKRPALRDIEVEVRAGEVVALVGENGSGKTTLAKLLCGLYAPTQGAVRWDDSDIRELESSAMRENITVIFQDFVRYALPARDNVGLGRHQLMGDDEAISRAVRLAGLERIFDRLPEGWDTVLGRQFTGGQDLSGGQWQRVALARAFYRDAAFLVLDEPTASLDARAEHRLFERLKELAAGRSVLLITHRFGNVRMADRIYVLHKGRVVEHGSHAELMDLEGRYAELFNLQAAHFLGEPAASAK